MMYRVDELDTFATVTLTLVRLRKPMMLPDPDVAVMLMLLLKPDWLVKVIIEFPFPPSGTETDGWLAEIRKSETVRVTVVLAVVGPKGLPVTVTGWLPAGVEVVVVMVRVLEAPVLVGVTVGGLNEQDAPIGRVEAMHDSVTG